ncbi:MAG: ABC transporter substrate-binding protein, partial [Dongiaceae bacterium]
MFPKMVRLATVAAAALLALAGGARSQELAPDALVKNVTLEVVDIIQKDIKDGDTRKVVALIETKVLPHFNFQAMTASAVGRNWEKASVEQKARLMEEFKTLV